MAEPEGTEQKTEQTEETSTGEWANQQPGGRATRGPDTHGKADTHWGQEGGHGWSPDAPGEGEAKERVIEGHQKAFDPDDTQAASRAPEGGFDVAPQPGSEDAGESITAGGEDIEERDGKDTGRIDTGTQGPSERPTGTSTARDSTGIDPQEPQGDAATMPAGDQGG